MRSVAIIPARGGSKRIPGKNIKSFCGKPIIAYSIITAKKSGLFDRIIVSTDDEQIADTAKKWGAEVPFIRPESLSDDYATTIDVIKHAIGWLNKSDQVYGAVCCIYATAPFIRIRDLKDGCELIKIGHDHTFAFPVTSFPSQIFRALKLTKKKKIKMFWAEHLDTRTQDLPEAYHDVGQFYWGTVDTFIKNNSLLIENSSPIIIPRYLAQDIDTPEDWELAELLYQALHREK